MSGHDDAGGVGPGLGCLLEVLHGAEGSFPADWHVHCIFIERSQRPPRPPSVSVNYSSDDGHESVSLSEYAVADKPLQYDLVMAGDGWQTLTHDGTPVQIRRGGPQSQAQIQREGTFVFLTSETLSGDQLAAIAAGLKPARGTRRVAD